MTKSLVTGGAGFIGANFIRYWLAKYPEDRIVNYDALTYAGNLENLEDIADNPNYRFIHADICDQATLARVFEEERIDHVAHLAAESHVDRSILGPGAFVRTNVQGTFTLLDVAREAWSRMEGKQRFLNVSTDEVYGSLGKSRHCCCEDVYHISTRKQVPLQAPRQSWNPSYWQKT